jgi:glycosyltransferase involved in cell wall biosynthesis
MTNLVSVILNVQDSELFCSQAIESVLRQTHRQWELIVWDNDSRDSTADIVNAFRDPRIKYFYSRERVALYRSRVLAIEKSAGDFLAFIDADDIWLTDKIETQLQVFDDPDVAMSCTGYFVTAPQYSNVLNMKRMKRVIPSREEFSQYIEFFPKYQVAMSTLMTRRRQLFSLWKGRQADWSYIEDFDMVFSGLAIGKMKCLSQPLTIYRRHSSNHSLKRELQTVEWEQWRNSLSQIPIGVVDRAFVEDKVDQKIVLLRSRDALIRGNKLEALRLLVRHSPATASMRIFIALFLPRLILRKILGM